MAPDLNSVPASPRPTPTSNPSNTQPASGSLSRQTSTSVSRRTSQIYPMSPPPLPLASPGGSGHAFPPLNPGASGGYVQTSADSTGVPMRHPRPMTAAEMHLELEKEQEAVVNRLTRELSALRAHSASVASTTSMSSAADSSIAHAEAATGPMHPTSSRRHRSSSSVSRSGMPVPHRYSISSQPAMGDAANHRSSSVLSTPRYEEVAQHKAELEEVKKENEALKQRIRQLERMIRGNNESEGQRGRRGAPQSQSSVSPKKAVDRVKGM
ncbi:DivIC domain containing protein [Pyrenophora tritici-repentis]|nr:DivIC domain containing protein [Pyrenophora tritici-repentis]